ncbi:hypothetical protein [Sorangium sp. So ce1182]|uniref:hypothetical protein n=1 Tax=Sorangium sp. So ce1182 TaxID=3133334 RepID=UPI003F644937
MNSRISSMLMSIGHAAPTLLGLSYLATASAACFLDTEASADTAAVEEVISTEEALVPGQIDPIRVHAILASYDNGTLAPSVTPAQIRDALQQASQVFALASIQFAFDPETDVSRMNSTLLARECTLTPGAVVPSTTEPQCDYQSHNDERNRVAQSYPGKLVIYFSASERTMQQPDGTWIYGPKNFNWSNHVDSFVTMTRINPGLGLAHEIGHYLHLDHTFWHTYPNLEEARAGIRNHVELNSLSPASAYNLFDGDGLASTPRDPGPELFSAAGLDPCNAAQGTLNLLVTFSNRSSYTYSFAPDRENIMNYWDKTCRGNPARISSDQANSVRNAIDVANRKHLTDFRQQYSAVFEPGTTGQTRAIGWALTDFATRFNQEIAASKHLVHMQAYDIGGGQIRYDGAWENGSRGTTRAISWALTDFATRFNQEIAAGKHLVHMQAYDIGGGQIRYDGVWESGSQGTTRAISWALIDFETRFNQEIAADKHLVHMQAYDIGGGQIRYDGVWESGSRGNSWVAGWALTHFATRFNQEIAAGKHLVHMQAYDIGGGQIRYDGVWESGSRGTTRALGWAFNDFVTRNSQELASGKRLVHFQQVDLGNGQIRYDGVWENSTVVQTHIFAETMYKFAEQFNSKLAAGQHAVLMHSIRGR